jgi:hypothetical protein
MPRLTLIEQLDEAILNQDFAKAKELSDKIKKSQKVKEKKSKIKDDAPPIDSPAKVAKPQDSFIAPARRDGFQQKYVGEDGEEHTKSKRVPFKATKRKNTWEDDQTLSKGDIEFDKKTGAAESKTPRFREKAKQIKVPCSRCSDMKTIWPGELMGRAVERWVCDECLVSTARRSR